MVCGVQPTAAGFVLRLPPGAHGRVARGGEIRSLSGGPSDAPAGVREWVLDSTCRGKLEVGGLALLFQFVPPHARVSAPQLPAGYPSMVLLALLPPLWFRVMDPRAAAVSATAD